MLIRVFQRWRGRWGCALPLRNALSMQSNLLGKLEEQDKKGTEYTNWVIARSTVYNHDVDFMKRDGVKDRYSIHEITNLKLLLRIAATSNQIHLNEAIVLLHQIIHVCRLLGRNINYHGLVVDQLKERIHRSLHHFNDLICLGTYINTLCQLKEYDPMTWMYIGDMLMIRKHDEQYDELFGVYVGLQKYRQQMITNYNYLELAYNDLIRNIPTIYRNSLNTLRRYLQCNVYNLKEVCILLRAVRENNINENYFWSSVADWLNLYIKEDLQLRDMDSFFLVPENTVPLVLYDQGIIRPRPILHQLSQIGYCLALNYFPSWRLISFIQQLVIHSIQNGNTLHQRYINQYKDAPLTPSPSVNQGYQTMTDREEESIKKMEKSYKTVFVNPIDVKCEGAFHIFFLIKRAYQLQEEAARDQQSAYRLNPYDQVRGLKDIDVRVMTWLVNRITRENASFSVKELLVMSNCSNMFEKFSINTLQLITSKLANLREAECNMEQLLKFMDYLPRKEYHHLIYAFEWFLTKSHPIDIQAMTDLIINESITESMYKLDQLTNDKLTFQNDTQIKEWKVRTSFKTADQAWMPYCGAYFIHLPQAINIHKKYFTFEENCYYLYLIKKYEVYWKFMTTPAYEGSMEQLIANVRSNVTARGFKFSTGSNIYKLLNHIDLAEFFNC